MYIQFARGKADVPLSELICKRSTNYWDLILAKVSLGKRMYTLSKGQTQIRYVHIN